MNDDPNPRSDDARLRALLATPQAPGDLRERIRTNLAAARSPDRGRRRALATVALLGAVLLAGMFWLIPVGERTPNVVSAAYDDMLKDRGLHGSFNGDPQRWLATKAVHMPAGVRLDLSKDCALGAVTARHLRLVNPELGRVNVFVYEQSRSATTPTSGAIAGQHWLLLEPRPGLVALVLYDSPQKRESVLRLVARMFATPIRV